MVLTVAATVVAMVAATEVAMEAATVVVTEVVTVGVTEAVMVVVTEAVTEVDMEVAMVVVMEAAIVAVMKVEVWSSLVEKVAQMSLVGEAQVEAATKLVAAADMEVASAAVTAVDTVAVLESKVGPGVVANRAAIYEQVEVEAVMKQEVLVDTEEATEGGTEALTAEVMKEQHTPTVAQAALIQEAEVVTVEEVQLKVVRVADTEAAMEVVTGAATVAVMQKSVQE